MKLNPIDLFYNLINPWVMSYPIPKNNEMKLADIIPSIALKFVGRHEFPKGSNSGPDLQEFFDADDYDPNGAKPGDSGYAWCASYGARVVQLSMEAWVKLNPGKMLTFSRPKSPSVFAWEFWSLAQDNSTKTFRRNLGEIKKDTVKKGDILLLSISHFAISTSDADSKGRFNTVEGNTNEAGSREGWIVATKNRSYTELRTVIRFTV